MKYTNLQTSERIPVIGLGTWSIGGGMSANRSHDRQLLEVLRAALDMGYRHFDTAEMYGNGHTEELLGQAIRGLDREEVFITTKVSPSNLRYAGVMNALEGSLRRLDTSFIDLYLIHWPSRSIPLEESFRALNQAVEQGKVRRLGVSNFGLGELEQSVALSDTPIITNQVPYSLTNRRYVRNGVLQYCQDNGILLTAYSPLKGGVLGNPIVREIAQHHDASPAQVALNWLIRQPKVITIPQSTDPKHLRDNLEAVDLELTAEEVERLDHLA